MPVYALITSRIDSVRYVMLLCAGCLLMCCVPKSNKATPDNPPAMMQNKNAHQSQKRIAVLELRGSEIAEPVLNVLTDELRKGVLERTNNQTGFLNMTRESILSFLNDNGIDPKCLNNTCEVSLGRSIGSDYIVTGEIVQMGSIYFISTKLYETKKGNVLSMESTKIKSIEEGFDVLQKIGSSLIRKGLPQEKVSSDTESTIGTQTDTLVVRLISNQLNRTEMYAGQCYNDAYHSKVMERNKSSLQACLQKSQNKRSYPIQGTMKLYYTVKYDADPYGVRIKDSTFAEKEFEDCVIAFIDEMTDYRKKSLCIDDLIFSISTPN